MKKECIAVMINYIKSFQEARRKVIDEVLNAYLKPRELEWIGNPCVERNVGQVEERQAEEGVVTRTANSRALTKNHQKKLAKLAETQRKKQQKNAAKALHT